MLQSPYPQIARRPRFFRALPEEPSDADAIPQVAGLGSVSSVAFRSSTDWRVESQQMIVAIADDPSSSITITAGFGP